MAWEDQEGEESHLRDQGERGLVDLFEKYRPRLERLVRLRLDRRLLGRVDVNDILQDAYLAASRRLPGFLAQVTVPVYVWLRQITLQVLTDTHRFHWGARMRSVELEIPLSQNASPNASSVSLAAHLVDNLTSPSGEMERDESLRELRDALEQMDPIDREILALRHFEELGNNDVARLLGIQVTAASMRYIRALKRLRGILAPEESRPPESRPPESRPPESRPPESRRPESRRPVFRPEGPRPAESSGPPAGPAPARRPATDTPPSNAAGTPFRPKRPSSPESPLPAQQDPPPVPLPDQPSPPARFSSPPSPTVPLDPTSNPFGNNPLGSDLIGSDSSQDA